MPRVAHAAQIDLCFGDLARECHAYRVGVRTGDFAGELPLIILDRNKREGLARDEMRFWPREYGPGRFWGPYWRAHSPG